jgi:hypothetical protein
MAIAPPTVPQDLDPKTREYLQRFSAWMAHELFKTVTTDQAVSKILLLASDEKPPKHAFQLTVNSGGALSVTAVPLGSTPT